MKQDARAAFYVGYRPPRVLLRKGPFFACVADGEGRKGHVFPHSPIPRQIVFRLRLKYKPFFTALWNVGTGVPAVPVFTALWNVGTGVPAVPVFTLTIVG